MRTFSFISILTLLAYGQRVASLPFFTENSSDPDSKKAAALRDIEKCTNRQGKALWRPGSKDYGLPLIKREDVVTITSVQGQNYPYFARLAAMAAWSQFAVPDIQDMFTSKDGARKDQESYCIYDDPEMSKVRISIGSNRTADYAKYPSVEYTDLLNELKSVENTGGWPTYWAYLLGKTLKEKWYPKETPEDQVAIDKVEEYAIAYCSILTGEECVATGTTEPHVIKEGEVETKWADEVVHRVLMRSKITPVIAIEPADVGSKGVWAVRDMSNIIDFDLKYWNPAGGNYVTDATASLRVVHVKGAEIEGPNDGPWSKFVRNKQ